MIAPPPLDELRTFIARQHKRARRMIAVAYLMQAGAAFVGALSLWCAIESFVTERFFWCALQIAFGWFNAEIFIKNARFRKEIRVADAQLSATESRLP